MNEYGYPLIHHPQSPQIDVLMKDLLQAKDHYEKTGLSGKNAHQKYDYARLEDIYRAVESSLKRFNILIIHQREWYEGNFFLVTRLFHTVAQQWVQDIAPIENEKPGNQGHCIAVTYMKKSAVLNLCSIAAGEDDDAESEQIYIRERNEPRITMGQQEELQKLIKEHSDSVSLWRSVKSYNNLQESISELPASKYGRVKHFIMNYKKQ